MILDLSIIKESKERAQLDKNDFVLPPHRCRIDYDKPHDVLYLKQGLLVPQNITSFHEFSNLMIMIN